MHLDVKNIKPDLYKICFEATMQISSNVSQAYSSSITLIIKILEKYDFYKHLYLDITYSVKQNPHHRTGILFTLHSLMIIYQTQ